MFVLTTRVMYLEVKDHYFNNYELFTSEEREAQIKNEVELFTQDVETISKSMSSVCDLFHAVRSLPKENTFSPGNIIFLFTFFELIASSLYHK